MTRVTASQALECRSPSPVPSRPPLVFSWPPPPREAGDECGNGVRGCAPGPHSSRWRVAPSDSTERPNAFQPPLRRDVPAAEVHVVDAGHFALDEQPDVIADLTRGFLQRRQAHTDG